MDFWDAIWSVLNTPLTQVQDRDLTLLSLFQVCVILFVSWSAGKILSSSLNRYVLSKLDFNSSVEKTISRSVRVSFYIVGLYVGLTSIGFDLAIVLVPLGGLSVGIGFGAQDLARNLIAGIITMGERRVRPGDTIEIRGMTGIVKSVSLRSTTVELTDGIQLMLANADFLSQPVKIHPSSPDDIPSENAS